MIDTHMADLLARYDQTSNPANLWPICPEKGHLRFRNVHTGRIIHGQCGTLSCHACLVPLTLDTGGAIGLASPDYLVLLTQVGSGWVQARRRFNRLKESLTRKRILLDWAYHIEPNPGATGHHAHVWVRGSAASVLAMRRAASQAGMGSISGARAVHGLRNGQAVPVLAYVMKACANPPDGATELWAEARDYLDVNGGRLVHASRGFWRDLIGRPLGGIRAAIRESRRLRGLSGGWRRVEAPYPS